jgi:hypothetical protein
MLRSSDFMFTAADFAKITRTPEVVLTFAFGAILFAYFSVASVLA